MLDQHGILVHEGCVLPPEYTPLNRRERPIAAKWILGSKDPSEVSARLPRILITKSCRPHYFAGPARSLSERGRANQYSQVPPLGMTGLPKKIVVL